MAETQESLVAKTPSPPENTVTLGTVSFDVAQGVYHPPSPWNMKDGNQFIASYWKFNPKEVVKLNRDLKLENFLGEYEKLNCSGRVTDLSSSPMAAGPWSLDRIQV